MPLTNEIILKWKNKKFVIYILFKYKTPVVLLSLRSKMYLLTIYTTHKTNSNIYQKKKTNSHNHNDWHLCLREKTRDLCICQTKFVTLNKVIKTITKIIENP